MVLLNQYARALDLNLAADSKLFGKATTGSTKKFNLTNDPDEAEEFKLHIDQAFKDFAWGHAVTEVPTEWDENDIEVTQTANVLRDFRKVTELQVHKGSGVRFGCTFNDDNHNFTMTDTNVDDDNAMRVRLVMVGLWLKNSLSVDGLKAINNDRKKFEYVNTDGSTAIDGSMLLLLILKKIMPSTKVGVTNKKTELINMNPTSCNGDIGKMITKMQTLKSSIENESGKEYEDFILHLFNACEKSSHDTFQKFASTLRSDWESDNLREGTTETDIIDKLTAKWNNECQKSNKSNGKTKVKDPEDAKMLALFTALTSSVQSLSQQVQHMQKGNGSNSNGNRTSRYEDNIATWRKSKDFGDSVEKDGKKYYWCPKHLDGNGLYVTHHPKDHGVHRSKWQHTTRVSKDGNQSSASNGTKLQLSEKMQSALTSNGFSAEQAKELLKNISSDSSAQDFW